MGDIQSKISDTVKPFASLTTLTESVKVQSPNIPLNLDINVIDNNKKIGNSINETVDSVKT